MLSPYHPLQLALGLSVWAVWFSAAYGALSLGCRLAPPSLGEGVFNWLNLSLLALTLATGALLLWWALRCWRAFRRDVPHPDLSRYSSRFVASLAFGVNLCAGLSTLAVGAPLVVLMPCV